MGKQTIKAKVSIKQPKAPHDVAVCAERLKKLAYNLWWTWNPEAADIFSDLAPLAWERSNHNPIAVLKDVSPQEFRARLEDKEFYDRVEEQLKDFESYMSDTDTWANNLAKKSKGTIAYFSAEFGLHESLPIYSGGLGVLSGDHSKSASDLGLPFIGISLLYRQGFFVQTIGPDGWQRESNPEFDPNNLPFEQVRDDQGNRIISSVRIGHATVNFQAWRVNVGRAVVYFLDTNLPENDQHYQRLTAQVYGGDVDTRIAQEIVLGIGGVRLLRALGIQPAVYHMNEGHSAFLTLELFVDELKKGLKKEEAIQKVREQCIFTTHTPVPAGHDRFSAELMNDMLGKYWASSGLSIDDVMEFGRVNPKSESEPFMMTVLALRMSRNANGVSKLHGEVSREMWKDLFPGVPVGKVPIGHITNGIHTPSWASLDAHKFWNKRMGVDWTAKLMESKFWEGLESSEIATDAELWALRYKLRRNLVEFVRAKLREQHSGRGEGDSTFDHFLLPDALTICFARRFATYKRAPLIFRDLERIIPILSSPDRPVQLIFAGKAHPRDNDGKRFIQIIIEMTRNPRLFGRVVFLENYDMNIARQLVSGADIWLNTPRRPLEASGTSGMKVLIHGGMNLSIMDGWWQEGFNGSNGWKIGGTASATDPNKQDEMDFEDLYTLLTEEIIPDFYTRDASGVPVKWIQRVRQSMKSLIPIYNTDLMVSEYTKKYYWK